MRPLLLLPLVLAGCTREGAPAAEPRPVPPLALSALPSADRASCWFSETVSGPPLLTVRVDGRRLVGLVLPSGGEPVALATKVADDAVDPLAGAQMKGPDLTVAVTPAPLPGVPVGMGGERRRAMLTAATIEGGSVTLDGVWSCARR